MNKENNRNAAGLRRSAIAARIRLREEWSELKGTDDVKNANVLAKKHGNIINTDKQTNTKQICATSKNNAVSNNVTKTRRSIIVTGDVLRGVVALVEVGSETKALPLRAALTALGASVLPSWNPLVTHVVWSQGGHRGTRAKARALACRLVSPLWVEACAAAARRLPERAFPAPARPSDLPSPRTLRSMLKKAEMENLPLTMLLSDSKDDDSDEKMPRLRISSETEQDTSTDKSMDTTHDESADTSHDKSTDKSQDKSRDTTRNKTGDSTNTDIRVNTAPRRALPVSLPISPTKPAKSKRKLFTHKEAEVLAGTTDDESDKDQPRPVGRSKMSKLTQRDRRDLARAERMARRLLATCSTQPASGQNNVKLNVVVTGMSRVERKAACEAVRQLAGRVQARVTRRTTHVLLGSCRDDGHCDLTGVTANGTPAAAATGVTSRARTLSALLGAVRGARVLRAVWAEASVQAGRLLHHAGYEVPHLNKLAQRARVERNALNRQNSEYAYDVFHGMRVFVSTDAEQRDAAIQLLLLCGAVVQDGGEAQNGRFDVKIGAENGDVSSKWVFDSVAAARMRTARRYIVNKNSITYLTTSVTER